MIIQTGQQYSDAVLTWSPEHQKAANREGWDIFDSEGSANGRWQIQKMDDVAGAAEASGHPVPEIENDHAAWLLVYSGKESHQIAAREYIQRHNEVEWDAIVKHCSAAAPV
jgi:hypothetical protein